jgi:hypothetical protein
MITAAHYDRLVGDVCFAIGTRTFAGVSLKGGCGSIPAFELPESGFLRTSESV